MWNILVNSKGEFCIWILWIIQGLLKWVTWNGEETFTQGSGILTDGGNLAVSPQPGEIYLPKFEPAITNVFSLALELMCFQRTHKVTSVSLKYLPNSQEYCSNS